MLGPEALEHSAQTPLCWALGTAIAVAPLQSRGHLLGRGLNGPHQACVPEGKWGRLGPFHLHCLAEVAQGHMAWMGSLASMTYEHGHWEKQGS